MNNIMLKAYLDWVRRNCVVWYEYNKARSEQEPHAGWGDSAVLCRARTIACIEALRNSAMSSGDGIPDWAQEEIKAILARVACLERF